MRYNKSREKIKGENIDDASLSYILDLFFVQLGPLGNPGHVLPLPDTFFHYDLNGDGTLKLNELAQYLGLDTTAVEAPFIITDTNGNFP